MTVLDAAQAGGPTAVAVESHRAAVLTKLGRYEEALKAYQVVIPGLRRLRDPVRLGRALNNRGLLHVYTGRFTLAQADLARAEHLMLEVGNVTEAAGYCHNRGFAAARQGDLPTALALFEEADRRCRAVGVQPGARDLDRAGVLEAAGLLREAREVAQEGLAQLRGGGNQSDLAEGLVLLSDITLLLGDPVASRAAAEEAALLFELQHRSGWRSLAQAALASAGLAQGDNDASLAALASEAAAGLDSMGQVERATMAHAVAGRLWLAAGCLDTGIAELSHAGSARRRGTAAGRLAAWEAEGIARLARGDRRGAMVALSCTLAVVNDQQANLVATELRAHVSVHAADAARLGLRLAVSTRRASSIWQWMERHRANSVRPSPVRPPRDDVLAGYLAELRGLGQEIGACASSGDDPAPLLARQSELERRARERAWQASSAKRRLAGARLVNRNGGQLSDLFAALGEAALVEFAEVDGAVHAVVAAGGRCYHRRVAMAADARHELDHVRLALRRLAYGAAHPTLGTGAAEQLARATGALDRLLLSPIAPLFGSRPLVVVPTGELHATPWAALPTLAGRAVSVAPSARLWLEATSAAASSTTPPGAGVPSQSSQRGQAPGPRPLEPRTVVVAGPGLAGAEREAVALGSLYPSAQVLTGEQANVAAVVTALEGAEVVHVAAHGRFRSDNGLWSNLELADGVLTVYELEQLRRPPQVVVLSACQSGLSAVRPGDELMGLVAALLTLGPAPSWPRSSRSRTRRARS